MTASVNTEYEMPHNNDVSSTGVARGQVPHPHN